MPFYEQTFDFSGLDALQRDIQSLPSTFADAMLNTAVQVETAYLPRLQEYPANRAVHPFVWSHDKAANARARRKYFHLINSGQVKTDSYGYVRSGRYGRSWIVDVQQTADAYTITVTNTFPAATYVGGARQVPGHANTGWTKYPPILNEIGTYADEQFYNTIKDALV